jgi:hypothetical protein
MPTIIEACPISINLGPMQMEGILFVADPPEDSYIEAQINVPGFLQVDIEAHVGEPMVVDIIITEGPATLTITFDIPANSFLCQVQRQDTETEAKWHVLATLSRP